MSDVTINGGAAGTVTIPATTAGNLVLLQAAIDKIAGASVFGVALTGGDIAPGVPAGQVGVAVVSVGGSVTVPTGYGIIAVTGSSAATIVGGSENMRGAQILSGNGGITYDGGAGSIIATGGNNVITATLNGGGVAAQFVDVDGLSTVTGSNALIQTEGGAASINALTGNFVVTKGSDTINTGAGPNTVAATGSVGSITFAGSGDLTYVTGGSAAGVQTIMGGLGNETVFAGPKSIFWQGSNPGGSLLFIGGSSASTVIGGGGQETLFGGVGGGVFNLGAHDGNVFIGDAATYSVDAGSGSSALFTNTGSNITFTGASNETGNVLVVGGTSTVNAANSHGNVFIAGGADATLTGSSSGGDEFDIYNRGAAAAPHTITIEDYANSGGVTETLVFLGYGFNPTNVHDGGALASAPTQNISSGSNHITLSDHTTIILQDYAQIINFNNFNAVF